MAEFDTETFERHFIDAPITSLRRIETLYGAIEEARSSRETVVDPEYQLYVTPGELNAFTTEQDEENRLVTVRVDLTGDDPELVTIDVDPLRPENIPKLGYSEYPWGRAIDNSITRRGAKGGSSRNTVATYCAECLERWTNADGREPAVGRVAEEHPDGWVIQSLQQLGQNESLEEWVLDQLQSKFGADASPRVVATVTIKLNPSDLEKTPSTTPADGFYYPGELPVLNTAMVTRKEEKLAEKQTDIPSTGEGTCLVTGAEGQVFGTAEDPLAFFTVQHTEKFPELKREYAWRSHPISSTAALLLQSGSSLLDTCRSTRRGRSIYTLPYFVRMDAMRAQYLDVSIRETASESQVQIDEIQEILESDERIDPAILSDLRFYIISLRNDSGDINVLHEVPDATVQPVRDVTRAHIEITEGSTLHRSVGVEKPENWPPISEGIRREDVIRSIVSGFYAAGTLAPPDEDDPSTDDPREWLTFALLTGESVPVMRLLEEYVDRLAYERMDDEEGRLSENHLKSQYVQLRALARAGLLISPNDHQELIADLRMTANTNPDNPEWPSVELFLTDDGRLPVGAFREYRLDHFLGERPALDDPQRRGAFLAGVLVGQLGYYQSTTREMNQTVLLQHPAEQMTGDRIERFVPELVDKANVYAQDDGRSGLSLFPEVEDRLTETLGDVTGEDWTLSVNDLRFYYALGQLYGKRATNRAFDLREQVAREAGIDLDDERTSSETNDAEI